MTKKHFANWAAFEAYLEELGFFRMELGLERISAVLERLGLTRLPCPTVQVAGTNGKGSTSTFIASLARAHGRKAMLHSSPHFVSVRERVRVFSPGGSAWGELLPEARWLEAAEAVMSAGGGKLTYFELITAIAAWLMRGEKADLAVLESGLGGTWDASSAIEADMAVFTPIALDHCAVLGNSIEEIARDKAGAMRKGRKAVSAGQAPAAQRVLQEVAAAKNTALDFSPAAGLPQEFNSGMALGIKGMHQTGNAALALQAWRMAAKAMQMESRAPAEADGLMQARLPGRMQFIQPAMSDSPAGGPAHSPLIVDGAHNPHGLAALGHSLSLLQAAPAAIIFNCMRDKEPEKLVPHLRSFATGQVLVPEFKNNPRAMPASEMASLIGLAATPVASLEEAIRMATQTLAERLPEERNQDIYECRHPLLVCGSLYLLGEFFALYPHYLTKDSA